MFYTNICELQSSLTLTSFKRIICTKKMKEGASFFSSLNSENASGPLGRQRWERVFTLKSFKLGGIKNEFLVLKVSLMVFDKTD